jgi:hypothetical protein
MQDLDRTAPLTASLTASLVADPATGLTPADLRRAAIAVCSYANDVEDARELLTALGLVDELGGRSSIAS